MTEIAIGGAIATAITTGVYALWKKRKKQN